MPNISVGQTVAVRCPMNSTITVTPGASGTCSVSVNSIDSPSFQAQTISEATTYSVVAGDTVNITARGAAATYTAPAFDATESAALRSLAAAAALSGSQVGTTAAALASTTGATSGDLAPPAPIVFPANSLRAGDVIRIQARFLKSGTAGACTPSVYFGDTNNSAAQPLMSNSISAASATHIDVEATVTINSSASFLFSGWFKGTNQGLGGPSNGENTTKFNLAAASYIFCAVQVMNAADTIKLISITYRVERSFP